MTAPAGERNGLLVALGVVLAAAVGALAVWGHGPIAPLWVIAAVSAPFGILFVVLRVERDTLGKELPYFDLWSFCHIGAGLGLGLLGCGLVSTFAIAVAWELAEIVSRVEEHPTNRVSDVVVAIAAWPVGPWLFSASYPVW